MENFKGTKGNWKINGLETLYWDIGVESPLIKDGKLVKGFNFKTIARANCDFKDDSIPYKEAEANAKLIAAAPEMLEMLNCYLADLNNIIPNSDAQRSRVYDVEELIKKATE